MLESIVASILNRVLGSYVENFDPKQLNIGIWGGDVKLKNLVLKKEALDKFHLPIDVLQGHLGELVLQIPWSNLKGQPVKVRISDVFLLAQPTLQQEYDAEDEERREQALKRDKLDSLDLIEKSTPSNGLSQEELIKNQSFTESLVTKIIDNLQITISNIHIRYEDATSVPGHPFSLGFTLEELSAVSTDHDWNPIFLQDISQVTRKLAKLSSLSVYWNTDSRSILSKDPKLTIARFKEMVSSADPDLLQYILRPVSGMGRITLNKLPTHSDPKARVQLLFDELGFVLDSDQYRDALWTAELFHIYMKTKEFKKFRPTVSAKKDPKAWLRYAAETVREQIHQKRQQWSWEFIAQRLQSRQRYMELYTKKMVTPETALAGEDLKEFQQLEYDLTYDDIKFYRSLTKAEIRKERAKIKATADSAKSQPAASWSSWIWGSNSTSTPADSEDLTMTEEQRKELYDAIEWDEQATTVEQKEELPQDQIMMEIEASLDSGSFSIRHGPSSPTPGDVAAILFNGLKARLLQRPDSFLVNLSLDEFRVDDKTEGTLYEQIVTVKSISHAHDLDDHKAHSVISKEEDNDSAFFWLSFEKNPLNETADSSLFVRTKSVTVFYNAGFLETVARFFRPPKTHLETIGAIMNAAGATVEGITSQTRIGLEYALQEHKTANIKLDLQAPLIVLPLDVTSRSSPCAIIDAGHISVTSDLADSQILEDVKRKQTHQYSEDDWKQLESLMYDKFKLQLHDTQVLVGPNARETMQQLHKEETDHPAFVLGRINMDFIVEVSILPTAKNIAKFKISGHLPLFRASMSDTKYKLMMQIIDKSIPNFDDDSEADAEQVEGQNTRALLTAGLGSYGHDYDELSDDETAASDTDADTAVSITTSSDLKQKIFVFSFAVDKVELSLHRCIDPETLEQTPLVDMVLKSFNLNYALLENEMTADVLLKALSIDNYVDTQCPPDLRKIASSENDIAAIDGVDLFNVKYKRTRRPKAAEADFDINDQSVEVSMSTIRFVVEPKTFLTLLDFVITTFTNPEGAEQPQIEQTAEGEVDSSADAPLESGEIDVRVNLRSVILVLNDDGIKLATITLDSATVGVVLSGETMNVHSRIGGFSVHDDANEDKESLLRQLVSIEGDNLADFRYETFDRRRTDISYTSVVYLRLGSMKVNFVEEPFTRIVAFLSRLNQMKGLFDQARQMALNQANQMESPDKVRFDIVISTPIFVFPRIRQDGEDCDVIVAHLGEIFAVNRFEPYEGSPVVANNISAGVRSVKLTSRFFFPDTGRQDLEIIDNIDMLFDISYVTEYEGIDRPLMNVVGNLSDIRVRLTERQCRYLIELSKSVPAVFSGSGLEDDEVNELTEELRQTKHLEPARTPVSTETSNVSIADKLEFKFAVETVSLSLYHRTSGISGDDIDQCGLSQFSLNDCGISLRIKNNDNLESEIHVHSFTVRDTRTVRDNKFPEIIPSIDHCEYQFMCKITRKRNVTDALLTVDSPRMILALDYLFALKGYIDYALFDPDAADEIPEEIVDDEESEIAVVEEGNESASQFHFHVNVVDFSVILLADAALESSEAIVFKADQLVLSQRNTMTMSVSKVGMFLCKMTQFNEERLRVVDDFSMTVVLDSRGSDATHQLSSMQIAVEPLVLRLSLRDILLALKIVQHASVLSEHETKELEVVDDSPKYARFSKTERRRIASGTKKPTHARKSSTARSLSGRRRSSLNMPEVKVVRGEELSAEFDGLRFVVIGMAHELPILDMCVKPFTVGARNWSSDVRIDMSTETFVNVFNPAKSAWEPLVETWDIGFNLSRTVEDEHTFVNLYSRRPMEISLTSQTIALLSQSVEFVNKNSEDDEFLLKPRESDAPYTITNETGYTIEVWSDNDGNQSDGTVVTIKDGDEIPWRFYDWHLVRENLSTDSQQVNLGVNLKDSPYDILRGISVTSEGEHLHILHQGSRRTGHRLLCEVTLKDHLKKIKIRSTLNLRNSTHIDVILAVDTNPDIKVTLKPGESRAMPIEYVYSSRVLVMPETRLGFTWCERGLYWKDLLEKPSSISCQPLKASMGTPFYFHAEAEFDKSLPITWAYPYMTVNLCAPIEVVNLLPFDFKYRIFNKTAKKDWSNVLKKGENSPIHVVQRSDLLLLSVHPDEAGYESTDFAIVNSARTGFPRESIMTTHSKDGRQRLRLRIHYFQRDAKSGYHIVVYCPYLILNKTGLDLQVQAGRNRALSKVTPMALTEGGDSIKKAQPKMWSFENEDPRARASIRVGDSTSSAMQSFDAIGSAYEVTIPSSDRQSEISVGVHITEGQGKYKLTRIVSIGPRFIVCNKISEDVQLREPNGSNILVVSPGKIIPVHFLREQGSKQLCIRISGAQSKWSSPFVLSNTGRTYVKVFKHGSGTMLLKVDVLLEDATLFLQIQDAGRSWPFSIRNFTDYEFIFYQANPYVDEQGVEQRNHPTFTPIKYRVPRKSAMSYSWDYPAAPLKELTISCNGRERRVQLAEIGNLQPMKIPHTEAARGGIVDLNVIADGPLQALVISPYDESQSMYQLKGNSQSQLNVSSSQTDLFSVKNVGGDESGMTITVSLEGLGISLVNRRMVELCYITFRGFECQYRASQLYETISMKVKWIQIDNQLYGGQYDVILFPSVVPKSTKEMENHPTLSGKITRVRNDTHGVIYIKYATILLQQITLEMDEDFLFSLMEFVQDPDAIWAGTEKDVLCDESLEVPEPMKDSAGMDLYIEALHIQPAQMDLSFVRTERINVEDRASSQGAVTYFFNILTMAIGNINDAPVKLNALFMENVRTQLPVLVQSVTTHYTQGFLYQIHNILGSADFLGNPVGLFNNISSGIMDIFYEPYHGFMISDRPQELGIGIAKGGLSFMKKSIFGVSDSVSKVTGSISKGLTAATLDKEFQSRRRIMTRNRPKHALYGITQGATSLFDGVTSGVSGLALAPMEGAMKEGPAGFFKGLGKGLVGLPTKTAIGFFDLASNVSEGVRNTTTVFDEEVIGRIRPARHIGRSGIVRPYSEREAIGQQLLKTAGGGRYFKDEYLAHVNMTADDVVVLVTSTRIIMLFASTMKTEWEVRYEELKSVDRRTTGLKLTLRENDERGSFFIPLADPDTQRFLFKEIATAVTRYNRRLQTIS